MFSLESPRRGDSNEYTQYTNFNIKRKIDPNYLKSASLGFFPRTQARVRNSHGKRAISVRAIEVLLYKLSRVRFKYSNDVSDFNIRVYRSVNYFANLTEIDKRLPKFCGVFLASQVSYYSEFIHTKFNIHIFSTNRFF